MENNSYTNKEKALSLFKWSLKKFKAIIIAYTILMFVIFPMIEIIFYIIHKYNLRFINFLVMIIMIFLVSFYILLKA